MNYFSHGRRFLHDPYLLAGTAVPDWLNVVDRRIRARSKSALPFVADENTVLAAVARGIVQHHHDDQWFHQTRAFAELSLQFTLAIRDQLPDDDGFRPSFLGHILVELLLDAILIEEQSSQLDEYYASLEKVEPGAVAEAVSTITGHDVQALSVLIPRFSAERFLCDYLDDGKLLTRLNHVMRRVGLPVLPESLVELFPSARSDIRARRIELLAGEAEYVSGFGASHRCLP
jgi:hypothetical protein